MPSSQDNGEPLQSRREWSDIQQGDFHRSTTTVARKRKWTRISRISALVALALCVVGALAYASYSASHNSAALEPSASLAKVTFRTDGVLSGKWLADTLSVREGSSMTNLDIAKIRNLLESNGQIKSATVSLHLPNELIIEVRERTPILRVQAQVSPGVVKTLLIAGDGMIYEGANYPVNALRALPFVDGIVLTKRGNGFRQRDDMGPIADFLNTARMGWPNFYRDWTVVSLKGYRGGDSLMSVVEVTSRTLGKLVFSVHDTDEQFRRLSQTLAAGAAQDPRPIIGVNLSIPGQAIVNYAGTPPAPTTQIPAARPASNGKTATVHPQNAKPIVIKPSKGR